jgi:hypothetical protein
VRPPVYRSCGERSAPGQRMVKIRSQIIKKFHFLFTEF